MTQIAPQTINISKAASAADELFKTIDRESEIDVFSDSGLTPESCLGDIEISDVHFAYPSRPEANVLNGMSLKIPANKTTALVGASGCGKSTMVGLLERWYNPASGTLRLDGANISELNLRWLRSRIRVVQQVYPPVHSTVTISYSLCYNSDSVCIAGTRSLPRLSP
jgi:ATP-binding cassette, subfamily B (MDR/TAP), member 1